MSATAMEVLGKQAIKTFSRKTNVISTCFEDNLNKLKTLADNIIADDVNLRSTMNSHAASKAPVTYVEMYEDRDVTIGIFILKPGSSLPLHDHPKMHGILKVLSGTLTIQSYTKVEYQEPLRNNILSKLQLAFDDEKSLTVAKKHPLNIVNNTDGCYCLTALEHNVHEISYKSGQYGAFLDILAPPYSDSEKRECHYFQELQEVLYDGSKLSVLKEIKQPSSFWSDAAPYFGPPITNSF